MRQRHNPMHGMEASAGSGQIWRALIGMALLVVTAGLGAAAARAQDALTIEADGKVTIGPPGAALVIDAAGIDVPKPFRFGDTHGQMLSMRNGRLGLGTQPSTLYMRAPRNFGWYLLGTHEDGALEPGTGGTLIMSLSSVPAASKGTLDVNGSVTATSIAAGKVLADNKDILDLVNGLQAQIDGLKAEVQTLRSSSQNSIGQGLRMVRGGFEKPEKMGNFGILSQIQIPMIMAGVPDLEKRPKGVAFPGLVGSEGYTVIWWDKGLFDIAFDKPFSAVPAGSVTQVYPGGFKEERGGYEGGSTLDNAVIVEISAKRMRVKTGGSNGGDGPRSFSFIVVGPD